MVKGVDEDYNTRQSLVLMLGKVKVWLLKMEEREMGKVWMFRDLTETGKE